MGSEGPRDCPGSMDSKMRVGQVCSCRGQEKAGPGSSGSPTLQVVSPRFPEWLLSLRVSANVLPFPAESAGLWAWDRADGEKHQSGQSRWMGWEGLRVSCRFWSFWNERKNYS